MGQTPIHNLPYPGLSDPADVPADLQALAEAVDNALPSAPVVPPGGGGYVNIPVRDVGVAGQNRAGRQLTAADFTSMGLQQPVGLWSLSNLTNLGSDGRVLTDKGSVPFGPGINGAASTAAVFAGSTAQALYIADSGTADAYRIRTGSWGCWFRTAKRGTAQYPLSKFSGTSGNYGYALFVGPGNVLSGQASITGAEGVIPNVVGVSDVADDRWHHGVVTFDGATLRCYADGVLEAAAAVSGALWPSVGALNVGALGADAATAAGSPHYGRVDEAFITADVLSEDQIRCLYAAKLTHTLGELPAGATVSVHRLRKGAALAITDFPSSPARLHNFTAGALTDQGTNNTPLTNNGAAVAVAGADGTVQGGYSFAGAQSLSATDAGLPAGTAARSYGAWFKAGVPGAASIVVQAYGSPGLSTHLLASGVLTESNGGDVISGPFVADGAWHFVVAVHDNTAGDGVRRKLYLDGRLVGGSTILNAITSVGANRYRIGAASDGTLPFIGQIDGAFVCAVALTAADVAKLYAKGGQDLGGSPKNAGDHVERMDTGNLYFIGDTLEPQHTVDIGVAT